MAACDNISALRYSLDIETYPNVSPSIPDFDVINYTRDCMLPGVSYRWNHVKSHQDRMGPRLDAWAQLNILVDGLAKMHESTKRYWPTLRNTTNSYPTSSGK
jgi:hypothetical protein